MPPYSYFYSIPKYSQKIFFIRNCDFFMYSDVFKGSVSLAVVADALKTMYEVPSVPLVRGINLCLFVNEYFDDDGNRCYFH